MPVADGSELTVSGKEALLFEGSAAEAGKSPEGQGESAKSGLLAMREEGADGRTQPAKIGVPPTFARPVALTVDNPSLSVSVGEGLPVVGKPEMTAFGSEYLRPEGLPANLVTSLEGQGEALKTGPLTLSEQGGNGGTALAKIGAPPPLNGSSPSGVSGEDLPVGEASKLTASGKQSVLEGNPAAAATSLEGQGEALKTGPLTLSEQGGVGGTRLAQIAVPPAATRSADAQSDDPGRTFSGDEDQAGPGEPAPNENRADLVSNPRPNSVSSVMRPDAVRIEDALVELKPDPNLRPHTLGSGEKGVEHEVGQTSARQDGTPGLSELPRAERPSSEFSLRWQPVIERVAGEISARFQRQGQEALIQLDPPELGKLKIELAVEGDRVQARITAEVAEVKSLIQTHLSDLKHSMQAQSLELGDVTVDVSGSDGESGGLAQGFGDESASRGENEGLVAEQGAEAGNGERSESIRSNPSDGVSVWA